MASPTLIRAQVYFATTDDNKDDDTAVSVYVADDRTQQRIAWVERAADTTEFQDRSGRTLNLRFDQSVLKSACDVLNVRVGVVSKGNDTWRFQMQLILSFSDQTELRTPLSRVIQLKGEDSRYVDSLVCGSNRVAFLPSMNGLHFSNSFPPGTNYPVVTLPVVGTVISGDAVNGLCGGFAFTALDLFLHEPRVLPPADTTAPAQGSPRFNYLTQRLLDSFGTSALENAAKAIEWIQTATHDTALGPKGLARRMVEDEWPKIREDIDAGRPSPLMLVMEPGCGFGDIPGIKVALGRSHQVLAYAYRLGISGELALAIYDCNHPNEDSARILMNIADPAHTIDVRTSYPVSHAIRSLFHNNYTFKDPGPIWGAAHHPGPISAVAVWSGAKKAYFFMGREYSRYDIAEDRADPEYPKLIERHWAGMWPADIDAVGVWPNGKAYFFKGNQYIRYDLASDRADPGYPLPIAGHWPGVWESGIDAVAIWPNGKAFFFKGDQYIRYDIASDKADPGYPRSIASGWPGLWTSSIGAAAVWPNGKAFFFKGDQYIRYDIANDRADAGYPLAIAGRWPGLPVG